MLYIIQTTRHGRTYGTGITRVRQDDALARFRKHRFQEPRAPLEQKYSDWTCLKKVYSTFAFAWRHLVRCIQAMNTPSL